LRVENFPPTTFKPMEVIVPFHLVPLSFDLDTNLTFGGCEGPGGDTNGTSESSTGDTSGTPHSRNSTINDTSQEIWCTVSGSGANNRDGDGISGAKDRDRGSSSGSTAGTSDARQQKRLNTTLLHATKSREPPKISSSSRWNMAKGKMGIWGMPEFCSSSIELRY
jgi:hypothetical protein